MILIGDSIIKNVSCIDGCSIQSFCRDTISQLANKNTSKVAKLLPYDYVNLQVCTKDIDNRAPLDNIQRVRALRGYFGPLLSQKLKTAFHQLLSIDLLEE